MFPRLKFQSTADGSSGDAELIHDWLADQYGELLPQPHDAAVPPVPAAAAPADGGAPAAQPEAVPADALVHDAPAGDVPPPADATVPVTEDAPVSDPAPDAPAADPVADDVPVSDPAPVAPATDPVVDDAPVSDLPPGADDVPVCDLPPAVNDAGPVAEGGPATDVPPDADAADPGAQGKAVPDPQTLLHFDDPVMDGWPVFVDLPPDEAGLPPGKADVVIDDGFFIWIGEPHGAGFSEVNLTDGLVFPSDPIVEGTPVDAPPPDVVLDDPVDDGDPNIVLDDPVVDTDLGLPPQPPVDLHKSRADYQALFQGLTGSADPQPAGPPDVVLDDGLYLQSFTDEDGGHYFMTSCVCINAPTEIVVPVLVIEGSPPDWLL